MRVLRSSQGILVFMFLLSLIANMINSFIGSLLLFCTLLYFFYIIAKGFSENFILISIWLIFGPLFISAFISFFFIEYLPDFIIWTGNGTFVFLSIPIISVTFVLAFKGLDGFYERLKISLKINNIIIALFTFGFVWYAYSLEDFSKMIPSLIKLQQHNIGPREFIIFLLQIITFPYIISNLISDAVIEISSYYRKSSIKTNKNYED